ncbi:MAG: hypothetical protein KDN20_18185 [Verrucomicrobiae bacterium]|nr:hypothetical protein [Verrucomicrobiae bacterium]
MQAIPYARIPLALVLALGLGVLTGKAHAVDAADPNAFADLTDPAHDYWNRPLKDRFTQLKDDLENGKLPLDFSSEKAYVVSLLKALDIPVTSQMLVFSTTSLQLRMISPRNPRALYFNEDLFLGWVPGGKIEIVSIDPEIGGIFYIFDINLNGRPPVAERSKRCMNCHSDDDTRQVPGIVIRSVVPGPSGGSLDSFRREDTGHQIPFADRFGGWHLTGGETIEKHWGNVIGRLFQGDITTTPQPPGQSFNWETYPVQSSDILPQLLHEHQAGFVNRVLEAGYRARFYLREGGGRLSNRVHIDNLKKQADMLVKYLLFTDEAEFPKAGIAGDAAYASDFAAKRKPDGKGRSLRDFNMKDRIFEYRCSYMIYSDLFQALPEVFKNHVYRRLGEALDPQGGVADLSSHLSNAEKLAIREILRDTLADLPEGW